MTSHAKSANPRLKVLSHSYQCRPRWKVCCGTTFKRTGSQTQAVFYSRHRTMMESRERGKTWWGTDSSQSCESSAFRARTQGSMRLDMALQRSWLKMLCL